MRYPPATVNSRRKARLRSVCPDQVPWSMRVKRSWETLSNASAIAEQVVTLVKYSNAMRYIQSGSGIESFLPKEILCLFLCGVPPLRISCQGGCSQRSLRKARAVHSVSIALAGSAGTADFPIPTRDGLVNLPTAHETPRLTLCGAGLS